MTSVVHHNARKANELSFQSASSDSSRSSRQKAPSFAAPRTSIDVPPGSSYLTQAKLALTCAQAVPMVAMIQRFAQPAPGLSEDAWETEQNIPRQSDVLKRQEAVAVTREAMAARPQLLKHVDAPTNLRWLSSGFQLVLGAGFFGMYQHAGALRALAGAGLHTHVREICGLSSGAITGALFSTLGPDGLTDSILQVSLLDFLDLSPSKFYAEGALCAGKAVEKKIGEDTSKYGCTRLEDVPGPRLRIAVFDGAQGKTVWQTTGPLAQTVARSAALPVLFANDGFLDGGWVDHHGFTALRPKERALSMRMNTGVEPDTMQKLVRRPTPLFNVSEDPEHKTVALKPANKIDAKSFLFDIDWRKQKLVNIIEECEEMTRWWLYQPEQP